MDLLKKTIILTSSDVRYGGMGVLTIIKGENGVFGNFKTYNVKNCYDAILGILIRDKTIKQKVSINEVNNFKLDSDFSIEQDISCVLVDRKRDKIEPLIWFSANSTINKFSMLNIIYKTESLQNCENSNSLNVNIKDRCYGENDTISNFDILKNNKKDVELNKNNSFVNSQESVTNKDVNKEEKASLNNNIINIGNKYIENDNNIQNTQLHKIENKNIISVDGSVNLDKEEQLKDNSVVELFEYNDKELDDMIDEELEKDKSFFELIGEQIDELFSKYPSEKYLESIISNSKWVKVDFENNGKEYVLGLIYENDAVKYVCYGVPGKRSVAPPKDLEDYNQWVPLDFSNVNGEGYWLMYQDAMTGDSIKLEIG